MNAFLLWSLPPIGTTHLGIQQGAGEELLTWLATGECVLTVIIVGAVREPPSRIINNQTKGWHAQTCLGVVFYKFTGVPDILKSVPPMLALDVGLLAFLPGAAIIIESGHKQRVGRTVT